MGEEKRAGFRVTFDRKLKLEFHGTKVTSDAGLLAYRELDKRLGLTAASEAQLTDTRRGKNTQGIHLRRISCVLYRGALTFNGRLIARSRPICLLG